MVGRNRKHLRPKQPDAQGQRNRDHTNFYFGKLHHSARHTLKTDAWKNTCPPGGYEYREDHYRFYAGEFLRNADVLEGSWNWGEATPPNWLDVCGFGSAQRQQALRYGDQEAMMV